MPMVTSQILKFVNFTKIQKSKNLENETFFFSPQIKKIIKLHTKCCFMAKNSFVAEVTFKDILRKGTYLLFCMNTSTYSSASSSKFELGSAG